MRNKSLFAALGGMAALALMGCDTDDQPELRILTPPAGEVVSLGSDMKVRFTISANDFQLKAPGECNGEADCGQAWLNIDGNTCNQPGMPYNAVLGDGGTLGQDFFIEADFSLCPQAQIEGQRQITISLRREDGSLVIGEGDQPVQATTSVTVRRTGATGTGASTP
jgi:hypothetical protein